jgi:hypothetical protein
MPVHRLAGIVELVSNVRGVWRVRARQRFEEPVDLVVEIGRRRL